MSCRTQEITGHNTNWTNFDAESNQYFLQIDRRQCRTVKYGLKEYGDLSHVGGGRAHIKFLDMVSEASNDPPDPRYRWVTAASVKTERVVDCNRHDVWVTIPLDWLDSNGPGGYVLGKQKLAAAFSQYGKRAFQEGNTAKMRQCDGSATPDNGYQLWIRIPPQ